MSYTVSSRFEDQFVLIYKAIWFYREQHFASSFEKVNKKNEAKWHIKTIRAALTGRCSRVTGNVQIADLR